MGDETPGEQCRRRDGDPDRVDAGQVSEPAVGMAPGSLRIGTGQGITSSWLSKVPDDQRHDTRIGWRTAPDIGAAIPGSPLEPRARDLSAH